MESFRNKTGSFSYSLLQRISNLGIENGVENALKTLQQRTNRGISVAPSSAPSSPPPAPEKKATEEIPTSQPVGDPDLSTEAITTGPLSTKSDESETTNSVTLQLSEPSASDLPSNVGEISPSAPFEREKVPEKPPPQQAAAPPKAPIPQFGRVLWEILTTEESYVRDLMIVVNQIFIPLRNCKPPLLPASDLSAIFSDIEVIEKFNEQFLNDLKAVVPRPGKNLELDEWVKIPVLVAERFNKIVPFFKMYSGYSFNFDRALNVLQRCVAEREEFKAFLGKCERSVGQPLNSFLIKPIQRLPRYVLLLAELMKQLQRESPETDTHLLGQALTKIKQVASHLDSAVRQAENAQKILSIQNNLSVPYSDFAPSPDLKKLGILFVSQRRFLREGVCLEINVTGGGGGSGSGTGSDNVSNFGYGGAAFSSSFMASSLMMGGGMGGYAMGPGPSSSSNTGPVSSFSIKERGIVLFNDCLLVCKKGRSDALTLRRKIAMAGAKVCEPEPGFFGHKESLIPPGLSLSNAVQIEVDASRIVEKSLLKDGPSSVVAAAAKSKEKRTLMFILPKDRDEWMADFKAAIEYSETKPAVVPVASAISAGNSSDIIELARATQAAINDVTVEDALSAMLQGSTLLKHGRSGKPHFRYFQLSPDGSTLLWGSSKKTSSVALSTVTQLELGQKTAVFQRNPSPELAMLSFSIHYTTLDSPASERESRTLDIVCKDNTEFLQWTIGIRALLEDGEKAKAWLEKFAEEQGDSCSTPRTPSSVTGSDLSSPLGSLYRIAMTSFSKEKPFVDMTSVGTRGSATSGDIKTVALDLIEKKKSDFQQTGQLHTWGQGSSGALGHGDDEDRALPSVVKDFLFLDVSNVALGPSGAIAVTANGEVFTWGNGEKGRLGHNDEKNRTTPCLLKGLPGKASSVSIGMHHCMVVTEQGIFMWGSNEFGQLGVLSAPPALVPTPLPNFACKQKTKRSTATFATTEAPLIEIPEIDSQASTPRSSPGGSGSQTAPSVFYTQSETKVICGWYHSAILTDGKMYIWGKGESGQLGLGDKENRDSPVLIDFEPFVPKATASSLGGRERRPGARVIGAALGLWHTLVLVETTSADFGVEQHVLSFGSGTHGQLGLAGMPECVLTPTIIPSLERCGIIQVAVGISHSACLTASGMIFVWGSGTFGQIGDGTRVKNQEQPCLLSGLGVSDRVKFISCGSNHTLALTESGKVYGWGAGLHGRLGVGTEADATKPVLIEALSDKPVRTIAAGGMQSACVTGHMWVPDSDQDRCMACSSQFTVIKRRHHCRQCGGLFCGACTTKRAILLKFGFNSPVRVCDNCFVILNKK